MAIVPARISLSVYDDRGGGGTFLVHVLVDDTQTLAAANTAVAALATILATVSTAGVKLGELSLINLAAAGEPAGFADSNIGAGAVVDFSNASNPSTYGLYVPSFLDSLIATDGTIDITAGATAAFVASMIGAVLGGHYANAQYIANLAGLDAFLSNRKRKRRIRP
jgi:hypothetical protein